MTSRREWVISALGVAASMGVAHEAVRLRRLPSPALPRTPIARLSEFPPGSARVVSMGAMNLVLIRRRTGELAAFDQRCPHLGCPVSYVSGDERTPERLVCPCHDGRFDLATGAGIAGPPRSLPPLPRFVLEVRGDEVFVAGG
jgi:arsenite oxidase small subunit